VVSALGLGFCQWELFIYYLIYGFYIINEGIFVKVYWPIYEIAGIDKWNTEKMQF
jgi:hypothetical protein